MVPQSYISAMDFPIVLYFITYIMLQRVIAILCFCTFYAISILYQFYIRFYSLLEYTVRVAIYSQQQVPHGRNVQEKWREELERRPKLSTMQTIVMECGEESRCAGIKMKSKRRMILKLHPFRWRWEDDGE